MKANNRSIRTVNHGSFIQSIKKIYRCICILFFVFCLPSCKKFVETDPPQTALTTSTVFSSDATATAAVIRMYVNMTQYYTSFAAGESSLSHLGGLCSDELLNYSNSWGRPEFVLNQLSATNEGVAQNWNEIYALIYSANSVLEGLKNESAVTASVKAQLEGEAKFMRAFFYFYLVNFWGDVPLVTTTNYKVNALITRTPVAQVYDQIISDLKDAQTILNVNYLTSERIRPNKFTATALLARVYLYKSDWGNAETQATSVINNPIYSLVNNSNNVFLNPSTEAIWQLQSIVAYINTWDGYSFVLLNPPDNGSLNTTLVNAFEAGDSRRTNWVSSYTQGASTWYYPSKYKVRTLPSATSPKTEYSMVFRLAEQYLIRAEARAKQGNIAGAQADVNMIRNRAGLGNTTAATQAQLLTAIEQERRVELFCEWGHRWLDLKRTNRADAVLGPVKAPNWQATDVLFPIPQLELSRNPNLTQNPGY
jgi:hypothetical protein